MNQIWAILMATMLSSAAFAAGSNGGGHVVGNPKVSEQAVGSVKSMEDSKDEKDSKSSKTKDDCSKEKKEGCSAGKGKKASADCTSDCDAKKEAK